MVTALHKWRPSRRSVALALCAALAAWVLLRPWQFVGLWLTPDQQGWLLYHNGDYARAAQRFSDPRWRGMALYAAQDFAAAAQYFSQYQDAPSLLARGNSLAHQREYLDARAVYRELAARFPDDPAPAVNLPIVQELIDGNRMMSESQAAEMGDLTSEQDEGPRSSEGDDRVSMVPREQLSAAQLR